MRRRSLSLVAMAVAAIGLVACSGMSRAPQSKMSFFVTSANPGKGADFGGLAGADRYCQSLAASAGAGGRSWRAYLSSSAMAGSPAVNARDRIGNGPWFNAKGEQIASSVDDLHGTGNKLSKQTALTEKGQIVSGGGDAVNLHDILTGSSTEGRAVSSDKDTTCGNWTKSGDGSAIVGHHDRRGLDDSPPAKSWNSSHATQGCSMDALKRTGGGGLLYCFAQN
ncbi:hypothetical protein [Variovorax sp. MHTC-1]|uniref:hypothetical protein n=1 Tax=Variovorax sp. MHTC-1 TaxID=2495593 RepID=UPI000F8965C1|nr:hypothetical protein EJI01_11995 [Variovorax sp. MHTC-1]